MGNGLAAFAAGFGGGYLNAKRQGTLDEERQQDRAMKKQEYDDSQQVVKEGRDLKISLANATRPAIVNENAATLDLGNGPKVYEDASAAGSDMRQARSMGLADVQAPQQAITANGKQYADRASANAAAATYDAPAARSARLSDAYNANSAPDKAMAMEDRQAKLNNERREFAKKAAREGYQKTADAALTGSAQAVFDSNNAQGVELFKALPTVAVRMIKMGDGRELKTYDYTGTLVSPDGTERTGTVNSHELNYNLLGYKDQMEQGRKDVDSGNKTTFQSGLLDAKSAAVDAKLAVAQMTAARRAGADGTSREERLRFTSLMSDAGRQEPVASVALPARRLPCQPALRVQKRRPWAGRCRATQSLARDRNLPGPSPRQTAVRPAQDACR